MLFFEKVLLVSVVVIWVSVLTKYETIAFLSRDKGSSESSKSKTNKPSDSGSNNQHRIRQSISDKFHRISDKISDKIHHRNDPKPTQKPAEPKLPPSIFVVPVAPKPPAYRPSTSKSNIFKAETPPSYDSLFKPKPYPNQPIQQPVTIKKQETTTLKSIFVPKKDDKPPPYYPQPNQNLQFPKNQGGTNNFKIETPPSYDSLFKLKSTPSPTIAIAPPKPPPVLPSAPEPDEKAPFYIFQPNQNPKVSSKPPPLVPSDPEPDERAPFYIFQPNQNPKVSSKPPPLVPSAPKADEKLQQNIFQPNQNPKVSSKPPPLVPSAPKADEKLQQNILQPNQNPQFPNNNPKIDTPPSYDSLFKPKPYADPFAQQSITSKKQETTTLKTILVAKNDEKPSPYYPQSNQNPQFPKNQGDYNPKVDTPPPYDSSYKPKPYPNHPVQPQPYPQQPGPGINQKQPGVAPYPQNPYNPGPGVYPQQPYNPGPAVYPQQPYYPGPGFHPQQPYYPPSPQKPGVFDGTGSGINNNFQTGVGVLMMDALAKKIFSSGKSMNGYHDYHAGMYNNYNYRPDRYGTINGDICTNNNNYQGIVYGQFICPIDGFSYDATKCCGAAFEQYCCTPAEYANFLFGNSYQYNSNQYNSNTNNSNSTISETTNSRSYRIALIVASVVVGSVILIPFVCCFIAFCVNNIYEKVPTFER